ncbi:hypothetical protein GC175_33045 [bacterium]|nr:hypothetical protein [bacterium]
MKKTNVLVADDHPLIDRVVALLSENSSVICLRIAQSYAQIQRVARLRQPDVILVGVHNLPECTEALFLQIQQVSPQSKVIVLVDNSCPLCMHRLVDEGAASYIPRCEFVKRPVDVITTVVQCGSWFESGDLSRSTPTTFVLPARRISTSPLLSEKEQMILQLVVDGYTDQTISRTLSIAERTVRKHLRQVYDKLGASCRTDAAVKAIRLGLAV